jgi:uncharacterized membrane protein
MTFTNQLFIILITISPILIITGFLMMKFPPKSINSLIGYRTKQSKSSIDKWRFAQVYSAIQLMKSGLLGSMLGFGAIFLDGEGTISVFIAIMIVLVLVYYPFYKTEQAMRMKFD